MSVDTQTNNTNVQQSSQGSKIRLLNDKLRPYFIKWKFGSITQQELNELYLNVKAMIWDQIYKRYHTMEDEDLFQDIWAHIQDVLQQWDENSDTYVSTWLHFVIVNWMKYQAYKERRRREHITYVSEYLDVFDPHEDYKARRRAVCDAVRKSINDDLDEQEKRIVQLMYDPNESDLAFANSKKKYYSEKISIKDICALADIDLFTFNKIKESIRKKFSIAIENDYRCE